MPSIFDIARSALQTYQQALAVTGENLANVNTPGYTRRVPVIQEQTAGGGVTISQVQAVSDVFADRQVRSTGSLSAQFDTQQKYLQQVQSLLGDINTPGLNSAIDDFFAALGDVSNAPADLPTRSVLLSKASALTSQFNYLSTTLSDQRRAIDQQLAQSVTQINSYAKQLADLNVQIAQTETPTQPANALRDQRNQLLNQLNELVPITTYESSDGQVSVTIGTGQALVSNDRAGVLSAVPNTSNASLSDLVLQAPSGGGSSTVTSLITSGRLKGALDVRDTQIPTLQQALDTLASSIVTSVNALHRTGYDLNGNTGQDFFAPTGTTAGTMAVALTDPNAIAASDSASGVPGNNATILAIKALQTTPQGGLDNQTFTGFYQTQVTTFASLVNQVNQNATVYASLHDDAMNLRASASGVSTDEELTNLIQYQRAYQVAGKLAQVADELTQTLLSLKQ